MPARRSSASTPPSAQNPKRLEPFGYKAYSQNDEDGILAEIFRRLGVDKGTFCEIGVENGLECNSLYLLHKGWRGAWIEGNADAGRADPRQVRRADARQPAVGRDRLHDAGQYQRCDRPIAGGDRHSTSSQLDFLSIDIDGMDVYLLEALEHSPKVICVEYNAKFRPPVYKKQAFNANNQWTGTDYFGASLVAMADTAARKGYRLVGTNITGANAFFVRNDLLNDQFDLSLTVADLYNPPRYYLLVDHFLASAGHRADFGPYTDLTSPE